MDECEWIHGQMERMDEWSEEVMGVWLEDGRINDEGHGRFE